MKAGPDFWLRVFNQSWMKMILINFLSYIPTVFVFRLTMNEYWKKQEAPKASRRVLWHFKRSKYFLFQERNSFRRNNFLHFVLAHQVGFIIDKKYNFWKRKTWWDWTFFNQFQLIQFDQRKQNVFDFQGYFWQESTLFSWSKGLRIWHQFQDEAHIILNHDWL